MVGLTGIRDGELITSSDKATQNRGTVIEVKGFYPPYANLALDLDNHIFKDTFKTFDFFKDKSSEEIKEYLIKNTTVYSDLYLDDVNLEIKFIKISGKFFTDNLTKEQLEELSSDKFFPIKYVYNLFPRKPGSKARKHTLIFRPSNWKLLNKIKKKEFNGFVFDTNNYKIENKNHADLIFDKLGIIYPKGKVLNSEDEGFSILSEFMSMDQILEIKNIIKWFTPSVHKSLIQKIIRTRAKKIKYLEREYKAHKVLWVSFTVLMFSPGAFVPNIQSYVTGLESATKRLAISIAEDSYIEDYSEITLLLSCALIAKNDRTWKPTSVLYRKWLDIIKNVQKDPRCFVYETNRTDEFVSFKEPNQYKFSYFLIKELKSFSSDISMMMTIDGSIREIYDSRLDIMHIEHCLDHHSLTEIVWYFDISFVEKFNNYSEIFSFIWDRNVSYNPRKSLKKNFSNDVIKAQKRLWISRIKENKILRNISEKKIKIKFKYPESLIAGLIGPLEFKINNTNILAVLKSNDINDFVITRRPSRDTKDLDLNDEEKEHGKNLVLKILDNGLILRNLPTSLDKFSGKELKLINGEFFLDGKNNFLENNIKVQIINDFYDDNIIHDDNNVPNVNDNFLNEDDIIYALKYTSNGIESMDLPNTDYNVLRRLIIYIEGHKSEITLFPIGRDGNGTEYTVSIYDTHVFWYLCKLCKIFPAALELKKNKFIVKNFELWSYIKGLIRNIELPDNSVGKFPLITVKKNLWKHQEAALKKLTNPVKHGNLIWITLGLGKTLIVISYIKYLIDNNLIPEYVVYTLPPAALDNVKLEFLEAGFEIRVIDMKKKSCVTKLKKGVVNFIYHDHMRMNGLDEDLRNKSHKMLFIVDEFHKTLGKSQRTSLALEISKLSKYFVGLSGTIINNTNTNELIQWLEMIVDFEVNEHNFWVAVGELVSNKIETGVEIRRAELVYDMDDSYYELVPEKLGGTLKREFNFKEVLDLSYKQLNKEIVKIVLELNEPVFIVAKDIKYQEKLRNKFLKYFEEDQIFLIGVNNFLTYKPEDQRDIRVVITTPTHSMGYTLTKIKIMITSVYLGNQTTREQLEGRINRIGQKSKFIEIITIHGGILSYIFKKYEHARSISEVLKEFSVGI